MLPRVVLLMVVLLMVAFEVWMFLPPSGLLVFPRLWLWDSGSMAMVIG